jgi:hypothetical protein
MEANQNKITVNQVVTSLEPEILISEVDKAVKQPPKSKSPGIHKLPIEIV